MNLKSFFMNMSEEWSKRLELGDVMTIHAVTVGGQIGESYTQDMILVVLDLYIRNDKPFTLWIL